MIHGDSFFKGRYAIALTDEVVSADSVLMRTSTGAILPVSQRPAVSIEEVQDEELPVVDVETLQEGAIKTNWTPSSCIHTFSESKFSQNS